MEKSVYSLVLMDDVVAAVDRLAYSEGASRSAMVNRILAEYTGYATPQQRIQDIFKAVSDILDSQSVLQPRLSASDAMLAMRSALQYKYNPSLRYTVELYPQWGQSMGILRASLRTQNPNLMLYLGQFYKLWQKLEAACLPGPARVSEAGGARYTRQLLTPQGMSAAEVGNAIADYVRLFDDCLKTFFDRLDQPADAPRAVRDVYTRGLTEAAAQL